MSQSLYSSLPLEPNNIRLLRILPNENEEADINCTIFVYPLHDSGRGTHRYEALSYVWGDTDNCRSICVNGHSLTVRANLHIALSRLRDPALERIIWIDAICINQEDLNERGSQVQLMAKVYSKASQVIIWLGEEADNNITEGNPRIASAVMVSAYLGLNLWKDSFDSYPRLQRLIRSITYLTKEANFRPKYAKSSSENFSLDIRPLSELIDTYYTRESTDDLDKVYAILAMCSDNPTSAGLLPDYTILWEQLFQQLVQFILCKEIDVRLPQDKKMAIIRSKGCVLGWVDSVLVDAAWNDTVKVEIVSSGALDYLGREKQRITTLTFPTVERYIEKDDIVCLLQGVSKPTIIRAHKDHFSVIMIAATPLDFILEGQSKWLKAVRSTTIFPRNFLLVWDLRGADKKLGSLECENLRVPINLNPMPEEDSETDELQGAERDLETEERHILDSSSSNLKAERIWKTGRRKRKGAEVWNCSESDSSSEPDEHSDVREYSQAEQYLTSDDFSETESKILDETNRLHNVALVSKDLKLYLEAEKLLLQVIQKRKKQLGTEHLQTLSSIDDLYSIYKEQGLLEGVEELEAMKHLLAAGENTSQISTEEVVKIASLSSKAMILLLERRRGQVPITEEVVKAAAANESCGTDMMELLLKKRWDLSITEGISKTVAVNKSYGTNMIKLLLRERDDLLITEEIVQVAIGNAYEGFGILRFLFLEREDPILITEEILKIAAGNEVKGFNKIQLLLEKIGDQVPITERVLRAAAGNEFHGYDIIQLLFEKRGDQILITEEVLKAAVGNWGKGYDIMQFLIETRGDQISITEEILKIAVGNEGYAARFLMSDLFIKFGDQFPITEETLEEILELAAKKWTPDFVKRLSTWKLKGHG
ncbi:hypothetical protein BCON_0328g00120 [Botryotinia convoluta]|uniref:Heterokaryon incompatibility domain-containing protein n=1 Tax=Botryotinia convoluta TaxID=54673 RepID=A0A4Z1HBF1_9HELO|nr:hypothetical protein BCON_0328g00120 [Botryotinia convoluta]